MFQNQLTARDAARGVWVPILLLIWISLGACGPAWNKAGEASDGASPANQNPTAGTSCSSDVASEPGVVVTDRGAVRGAKEGLSWAYKNIPYAAPPIGALRWRAAQAAACWTGIRDATAWGPACPQSDAAGTAAISGNEDCLQLNVWSTSSSATTKSPILFWIHGGGNAIGSATEENNAVRIYSGQSLAEKQQLVVVSINYRLGALGYFAHPTLASENDNGSTGNYAITDMVAALEWVRSNAAAFGGDADSVTIAGESAGAVNVCALVSSPLAKGLFHRAIMQSGGCTARTLASAQTAGSQLVTAAKCDGEDPIACMRALPADLVLNAIPTKVDVAGSASGYGPVIDSFALKAAPLEVIRAGEHHKVPMIVGANANETSRTVPVARTATDAQYQAAVRALFTSPGIADRVLAQYPSASYSTPWETYVALTSDAKFICAARRTLQALAAGKSPSAYRYFFTHALDNSALLKPFGAWHGVDVLYLFDKLTIAGYSPGVGDLFAAETIMSSWGRFARTGDPSVAETPWPVYDSATDPYLQIDSQVSTGMGVRTVQCDFWDSLQP